MTQGVLLRATAAALDSNAAANHQTAWCAPPRRSRLSLAALAALPPQVRRPRFDVAALQAGILHLGCGAFHRAHQAVMTQRAIEAETTSLGVPPAWGIVAASLRSGRLAPALKAQQGLYTVIERGPRAVQAEVVGSVREALHAPADAGPLRRWLLAPQLRIVTLTVTESGYCAHPLSGGLDAHHPDVLADQQRPAWPRSVPGVLVHALALRRAAGMAPPVLVSCDNLPGNGRLLRRVCLDMAALRDDGLAAWIERHVQFPSSMVDRIVPVVTDADQACAQALTGFADAAPVSTEPFRQWVIEHFYGPRPLWEAAGAEFVDDVAPWEASKLRLLNGGHLALACLGLLAGCDTVAHAMAEPLLRAYALRLLIDEQRPTLPPSDHDIRAYAHQLVARWRNPGIAHQLVRVGRNASGKLPSRLLAGLRCHLAAGRPAPMTLLAVAAWMACVSGEHQRGRLLLDQDQQRGTLLRIAHESAREPGRLVQGLLGLHEVFGDDLPRHPPVVAALKDALQRLQQDGPLRTVCAALNGEWPA